MLAPHLHTLAALIQEQPDRTLAELKDAMGTPASLATIWRAVKQLGFTVKKTARASEHDRPDIAAAREQWQRTAPPTLDPAHLVFLDETGVTTNLLRRYGRGARGVRVRDHAPLVRWETSTFIAGLRVTGLTARASSMARWTATAFWPTSNRSSSPRFSPATSSSRTTSPPITSTAFSA